jgi:peptide/nickel transport system ATP-binding protein/oligopeptide transport system ATP-binding protein
MNGSLSATSVLAVDKLVKHFRLHGGGVGKRAQIVPAVDGVSFAIAARTTLALVGESGCGKSTTARLIVQLLAADSGEIRLDGELVGGATGMSIKRLRRKVQMVFQDPYASLTPHLRIGTILREPLIVHRLARSAELRDRVNSALDAVGLSPEIANRYPHELSGGQRQRVGIARAIAVEPRLLVCDEPVSALDVSIRSQIINLLLDLQESRGLTYLFISHDLGLVDHISDVVAVMYLGKIVETAPTATFFAGPRHPYSRALLASSPMPDPRRRSQFVPLGGEIASGDALPSGCRFRTRCRLAIPKCAELEPVLRLIGQDQLAACHRAEES